MVIQNFFRIMKNSFFQFLATTFLLSFLIFFFNILVWLTINMYIFSGEIKNKLGVYMYIREWPTKEDASVSYGKMIQLKEELENQWLVVEFYDKKHALSLLSKRIPDVIKNFEKYWLENPIPPTMYIMFDDEESYNQMRQVLWKNEYLDIIMNIDDLWDPNSFKDQEKRVSNVIEFSNFVIKFYVFLSIILIIIIIWFILLIMRITFYQFYKQIEVEKLIWAFFRQIKLPFLLMAFVIIILAFAIVTWYSFTLIKYLNIYFLDVFAFDLYSVLEVYKYDITKFILIEFGAYIVVVLFISNFFLTRLLKKV